MSQAVGLLLQLGVGQLFVATNQCDAVRHSINGVLGKICNIQSHVT